MMYQPTLQEVTYKDYQIQYFSSPSTSVEQIDILDALDNMLYILTQKPFKKPFYHTLIPLLRIDWSSISPDFEIKNETFSVDVIPEELFSIETLEHDIMIHIPPKNRYTIEINIKSIRKGKPRVIEPEDFL